MASLLDTDISRWGIWFICVVFYVRGSMLQVVYFTRIFPYSSLTALLIRGVCSMFYVVGGVFYCNIPVRLAHRPVNTGCNVGRQLAGNTLLSNPRLEQARRCQGIL
jgi:hypothetical protein